MTGFKLFLVCIIFSSTSAEPARQRISEPYILFKSVNCSSSNNIVSGYKCFVKAYSRTNATLNIFFNLTRPLFKMQVSYDMRYKYLTNSQRSIINATYEACSIFNGTASNPVSQWIIGMIPNLTPIVHPCPIKGEVNLPNLNVDLKKTLSVFPAGIYVSFMKLFNDDDNNILSMKFVQEIVSRDKKEF